MDPREFNTEIKDAIIAAIVERVKHDEECKGGGCKCQDDPPTMFERWAFQQLLKETNRKNCTLGPRDVKP